MVGQKTNQSNEIRSHREKYANTIQLKQGWYDYTYQVDSNIPWQIDRNFFETENQYEFFVYFRPLGALGDKLVGYQLINYNARR